MAIHHDTGCDSARLLCACQASTRAGRVQILDNDWADQYGLRAESLQGAAFHGDCEHEVMEIAPGHRVVLTYNLYHSRGDKISRVFSRPEHPPLYNIVYEMLGEPEFLEQGDNGPQHSTYLEIC